MREKLKLIYPKGIFIYLSVMAGVVTTSFAFNSGAKDITTSMVASSAVSLLIMYAMMHANLIHRKIKQDGNYPVFENWRLMVVHYKFLSILLFYGSYFGVTQWLMKMHLDISQGLLMAAILACSALAASILSFIISLFYVHKD